MTLLEMKKKVLQLIEEISTGDNLTDDPDIEAKLNTVINQIQNELSRMKKIPAYKEIEVVLDDLIEFKDIDDNVYQIEMVRGIEHDILAN